MGKYKGGQEAHITRDEFKRYFKVDRPQAENLLQRIYDKGYAQGKADAEKNRPTFSQELKKKLLDFFGGMPGIGPSTLNKIEKGINEID